MKKLAIGCAVVVVLFGVAALGVGYYVYRNMSASFARFSELAKVPEIERELRVRDPYIPPGTEELTPAQVERFVRVQSLIRTRLGERFADFEQKYKTLAEKDQAGVRDLPRLLQAYGDAAAGWIDAKRAQVAALNDVAMSLDEYKWIREQIYRALGVPYLDLDFAKIAEAASGGGPIVQPGEVRGSIGPSGPESNRKLIEPYRKELESNLALVSFGL